MNPQVTDVSSFNIRTAAKFAILNKQGTLAEYIHHCETPGECYAQKCSVTHLVNMTDEEFDEFSVNLLTDYTWLADKGGTNSDADLREVENFWNYTPDEQEAWKLQAYVYVLAVSAPNRPTIYVDPQGYNYARYVGI